MLLIPRIIGQNKLKVIGCQYPCSIYMHIQNDENERTWLIRLYFRLISNANVIIVEHTFEYTCI